MSDFNPRVKEDLKSLGLPQPDQVGFVVKSLEQAIQKYDPIFGPFSKTEYGPQKASYKGAPHSDYDLKFGFGKIGDIEIELIEYVSGDTPHRDFLAKGGEGMHHLRFRVDKLAPWAEKLNSIGYDVVWTDRVSPEIAFAYLERAGDPLVLELLEYPSAGDPTKPRD